jgi:CubicO group peptidase (beta-lactamase class C family)
LLGLILGGNPNVPLNNKALDGWISLLENRLLHPLGMNSTYLYPPPGGQTKVAHGYNQAVGSPVIANGHVIGINLEAAGSGYSASAPPPVRIVGGGGTGAEASANVDAKGAVTSFTIKDGGGQGYQARPKITFSSGSATATAIVSSRKIVGISIDDLGSSYTTPPGVTITGGRHNGTACRDAKGKAHIANGRVTFVSIEDGGDCYEQPAAVIVEPGTSLTNAIPIWAPAGALHSTVRDMTVFAAAALGRAPSGLISPDTAITAGFKIAEREYACTGTDPDQHPCPTGTSLSALAWGILPEDKHQHVPAILSKNGGLPGFSTQVLLMDARGLAVVVFANSNGETDTGEAPDTDNTKPRKVAESIARNIFYALYYELVQPGSQPSK